MEMDQGKLFVGGISWDTNEDRLKEYFGAYGEVMEAVIMRDRATGRARGFGFVVFADPSVAERVIKEKHIIDGRTVEAKKAVPRDDQQHLINRIAGSIPGSPTPGRTKKIFVGGLPSTLTETDFKDYFEQFGSITDVVVMYDHNTQRPRGFGFITYDSEEAVERVLHKTFHELSGKMVEVKRAVPKELSPGPNRSPVVPYGFSRANSFLSAFPNLGSVGGYGIRYSPLASRAGLSNFGSPSFVNLDQGLNVGFGGGSSFSSSLGFGRVLSPYVGNSQSRYIAPIGYNAASSRAVNESPRNVWGDGSPNGSVSNSYLGSGSGGFGVFGANWGTSLSSSGYAAGNVGFGSRENSYVLGAAGFGRNAATGGVSSPFGNLSRDHEGGLYGDFYHGGVGGSVYGDRTWHSASPDIGASASYGGYGLGNSESSEPEEYGVGYDVQNRQFSRANSAPGVVQE